MRISDLSSDVVSSDLTVNAASVTAITAPDDANLKLMVPSAGVVLGDSNVLNPNTGQGDGKIEFMSDGMIGAVEAAPGSRAEERGVGEECAGTCRHRW